MTREDAVCGTLIVLMLAIIGCMISWMLVVVSWQAFVRFGLISIVAEVLVVSTLAGVYRHLRSMDMP